MRFNDILDCVNTAIEGERVIKDLFVKGHLVSVMDIKKSMGPYKQAYIKVIYANLETNTNFELFTSSYMDKAPNDALDKFILKAEKGALVKLIVTLQDRDIWKALIEGNYGSK